MFFKQRLTLACEATFWIIVAAAISAPQLASPIVSQVATRLQYQAPATWLHSPQQDSKQLSASNPQSQADWISTLLTRTSTSTHFPEP